MPAHFNWAVPEQQCKLACFIAPDPPHSLLLSYFKAGAHPLGRLGGGQPRKALGTRFGWWITSGWLVFHTKGVPFSGCGWFRKAISRFNWAFKVSGADGRVRGCTRYLPMLEIFHFKVIISRKRRMVHDNRKSFC